MQVGGVDVVLPFTEEDQRTFLSLRTDTYKRLGAGMVNTPDRIKDTIKLYGWRVRKCATHPENLELTGVDKRPFTKALEGCVVEQATPGYVRDLNCALITTLASDIGPDDQEDVHSTTADAGRLRWLRPFWISFSTGSSHLARRLSPPVEPNR